MRTPEFLVAQIDESGNLGSISESCIERAEKTYLTRSAMDTNSLIVQMKLRGEKLLDHWYYRSDQWVDQPYFAASILLQPYVGPASRAMKVLYGDGTYVIDKQATEDA